MRLTIHRAYRAAVLLTAAASIFSSSISLAEAQTRTLTRSEDFILFTGAEVLSLIGSETRDLHLYAYGPSGFRAIPFQVDKVDVEGRYVFPDETMRDPKRDGTRLDDNDEMVFMVKDAGDKCPEKAWVEDAVEGVEIELIDPRDGARAWVYLFYCPGADPAKTEDYVNYRTDDEREYVTSDLYELGVRHGFVHYDWQRLRKPDGTWGPDIFDKQIIRMKARLLNGAIPVNLPERDMKSKTLGVIDGPVRVIKYEVNYFRLLEGLFLPEFTLVYLRNFTYNPAQVHIPFSFSKTFLEVSLYYAFDFNDKMIGSKVSNPANPQGILLDGKPDPGIDDESEISYVTVSGPQGAVVILWIMKEPLDEMVTPSTYICEDLSKHDPDEDHPGELIAGFWVKSANKMVKGTYHYINGRYYPYPFSDEKPREILDMIEQPMEIKVRPLAPPPG